jgi:CMP-N-acetylneuraminic acid synthetase
MSNFNNSEIIAVIPMRKNSKGCPNKNITKINGIPLFLYSVLFANSLGIKAIISTDYKSSKIIPFIGKNFFYRRNEKLAKDSSIIEDVLKDLFKKTIASKFRYCLLLQPTVPFRSKKIFDKLKASFNKNEKKGLSITIKEQPNYIWKTGTIQNNKITNIAKLNRLFFQNRQSLPKLYSPDGSMYLFSINEFKKKGVFPTKKINVIKNNPIMNIDVDMPKDLNFIKRNRHKLFFLKGFEWIKNSKID